MKSKPIVISIVNFKGGIAKTTTSIHIGACLALRGYKVLITDFDPQRSLTTGYKIVKDKQYTIYDLLKGNEGFRVTSKADNLHILAGSRKLLSEVFDINILKDRLNQLETIYNQQNQEFYDIIIVDCPPESMERKYLIKGNSKIHIPNLNEIALTASNYAMIPLNAQEYSIEGLKNLLNDLIDLGEDFNNKLEILGVFFTMVMKNEVDFKKYYSQIKKSVPSKYFFESYIRRDKNIQRSEKLGQSIYVKTPNSNAGIDYDNLVTELLKKLN